MPVLGIGVWRVDDGAEVEATIRYALEAGYRSIDTAAGYNNEDGVGNAIKNTNIPREEIFVTTKVWNAHQGYDSTLQAFEDSMRKLKLDYLDLYLIHWPVKGKYKDTWKAMEKLYKDGRIRAIGVCNFHIHHLEDLKESAELVPMVNQVECHPLLTQVELREYCKKNNIQFEAWSPLMQGNLDIPILKQLAKKYKKSPAQIVLRWDLQSEIVTIPKSVHSNRIIENGNVFDFELSSEDMDAISSLNQNKRFGANPDNFNF
ncbi:MAG: aldo/keto reductase [Clostridiales bacterium]|nr:aldo/keto reductase [Clostridiales bacterium]